jgi:hypothetical protein
MANPVLDTHLGNPDPGFAPTSLSDLYKDIDSKLTTVFDQAFSYIPYVVSATTPGVNDQDKIWAKLDGAGRPIGLFFFYGGNWRRFYNASINDIGMFSGNPAGVFDNTGKGIVGTDQDGWCLANGQNGTINLSNQFVVAADMSGVGYASGWQSLVDGVSEKKTGGENSITSNATNTYRPARAAVQVGAWKADGNTPSLGSGLFGVGTDTTLLAADAGNLTPPAVSNVPPFYALAFKQFRGYS